MIFEHVITLALVLAASVVLIRWGGVIFFVYACFHFCAGEWFEAGMAFVLACFITIVRGIASWLLWRSSGYVPSFAYRSPERIR